MTKYIAVYQLHCFHINRNNIRRNKHTLCYRMKSIYVHFSKIIHSVPKNVSTCLMFLYISFWSPILIFAFHLTIMLHILSQFYIRNYRLDFMQFFFILSKSLSVFLTIIVSSMNSYYAFYLL